MAPLSLWLYSTGFSFLSFSFLTHKMVIITAPVPWVYMNLKCFLPETKQALNTLWYPHLAKAACLLYVSNTFRRIWKHVLIEFTLHVIYICVSCIPSILPLYSLHRQLRKLNAQESTQLTNRKGRNKILGFGLPEWLNDNHFLSG